MYNELPESAAEYQAVAEVTPLIELWLLRMLVPLGGTSEFVASHGFRSGTLAKIIGVSQWVDQSPDGYDEDAVCAELRRRHAVAENDSRDLGISAILHGNVQRMAKLVGLCEIECRILEFCVLLHTQQVLENTADYLGSLRYSKVIHVLSVVLAIPKDAVKKAFLGTGLLARSGLVVLDRRGAADLHSRIDLLSNNFAGRLVDEEADPITLFSETVFLSSPAHLTVADYSHIAPSLSVLQHYLRQSISTGRSGVNIFLYGKPGTGKSQLAKVLAAAVGGELFEIASEDSDGDPIGGTKRLRAFRAAQSFFSQRQAILLFDETEDVFNDGGGLFGRKSTAQMHKAWINRMLEANPVPTIWLSNSVDCMDSAFIRRFDMVVELPVPQRSHRRKIIQQSCTTPLQPTTLARLSESQDLSPAVVARAASVVELIRDQLSPVDPEEALELLVCSTLEAQGYRPIAKRSAENILDIYDPAFISADADLAQVAAGLVQSGSGRLCLYGPPGTGKSAYGRWLADKLGVPLIIKRASDLMSKWVGDNEKNIASAFRQAERDGALLLIDEVDSFLRDRRDTGTSWEANLVNEMLSQMESFSGFFIASTNLMEGLDQAALRRFDLKVKFDYLSAEQAGSLMNRYCTKLCIEIPQPENLLSLERLTQLTPGDFAAVARQHRFRPLDSARGMVEALEAECAMKERASHSRVTMGFLQ